MYSSETPMTFCGGDQDRNRNFGDNNYGGGPMGGNRMGNMHMPPWGYPNAGENFSGANMHQGGGGQDMNAQAINLANNLMNNLFRNLLGAKGNRNQRGGSMVNRGGRRNRPNNRRVRGGFQNRGAAGAKSALKQGPGGIRSKQNAFNRAKKLLAKNANNKKKDSTTGNKKNKSKESPYASVPNDMFYCHLCKRRMCDAHSFENHIKGRTHLKIRDETVEIYRLVAKVLRKEAKIAEQLKSIELDRLKRMGKPKQRQLEYCTMCDVHFHGHISAHRKSEAHLQLKKLVHPKCIECNEEFATRIDYDTHLLSADHLQKAAEKNTKVGERKWYTIKILTEEEELKDVRPPQKRRKKPVPQNPAEGAEVKTEQEEAEEGEGEEAEEGEGEEAEEGEGEEAEVKKEGEGEEAEVKKEGEGEDAEVKKEGEGEDAEVKKEGEDAEVKKEGEEAADEGEGLNEWLNETQEEQEVALTVDSHDCILDGVDVEKSDFEIVDNQGDGEDGAAEKGGEAEDVEARRDGEHDDDGDQAQEPEPEPEKKQPKTEPMKTRAKPAPNTSASSPVPDSPPVRAPKANTRELRRGRRYRY